MILQTFLCNPNMFYCAKMVSKVMVNRSDFMVVAYSEYDCGVLQVTGGAGFMDSHITGHFMVV